MDEFGVTETIITIIPAQPGYTLVTLEGTKLHKDPIVAWRVITNVNKESDLAPHGTVSMQPLHPASIKTEASHFAANVILRDGPHSLDSGSGLISGVFCGT
jgi:hypothetical protein